MRISISDALKAEKYKVVVTGLGREGIALVRKGGVDVVITDLRLPDTDGIEVLKQCKRYSPETKVILITAHGSVDTAVEAMRSGAYNYITKPFSMDELLLMIERVLTLKALEQENRLLKSQVEGRYDFSGILSKSSAMAEVLETVKILSQTDSTALIIGESGTGKELVANAIHYNSPRKERPFVKISCAALPETLLEAELFGYEKGAFTGALSQKKGRFEVADKGTLFLDEIGELSAATQVKLLRVLQEKEFNRLGSSNTISVDVRIICATQRDLKAEIARGAFREDLYYRLNVVPIMLPPLRERTGDALLLANHFLKRLAKQNNKDIKGLSIEAQEMLVRYSFPGNVRELENAIERAVVLAKGTEIASWDLTDEINGGLDPAFGSMGNTNGRERLAKATKDFEREYIRKVLEETKGNKGLAAKLLGVSRKTLWEKCKAFEN
jgi:two-component system response regulator HydG